METLQRETARSHDQEMEEKDKEIESLNVRVMSLERELQLQTEALEVSVSHIFYLRGWLYSKFCILCQTLIKAHH